MRLSIKIAMFIIMVSAIFTIFNSVGMFAYTLPGQQVNGLTSENVSQMTEAGVMSENLPIGASTSQPPIALNIFNVIISALCIIPICSFFGIPIIWSGAFQAVIWIVYLIDIADWWKNAQPN